MKLENMNRDLVIVIALVVIAPPAYSQTDLAGIWAHRAQQEDSAERGAGPEIGDYLGLPVNDSARLFADSWSASRLTLREHQCEPHIGPYMRRGPFPMLISEIRDSVLHQVVAIQIYSNYGDQTQTVWMDGRSHPSPYAKHSLAGFSTGKWQGSSLTITTTHVKAGWIRRNGLPESDRATTTEHLIRHGDYLLHTMIIHDPVYLTEPLIKTDDFVFDPNYRGNWNFPCYEFDDEIEGRTPGSVPHILPGQNADLTEFAKKHHIPEDAARGGSQTMYPEYQDKIRGANTQ